MTYQNLHSNARRPDLVKGFTEVEVENFSLWWIDSFFSLRFSTTAAESRIFARNRKDCYMHEEEEHEEEEHEEDEDE